MASIDPDLWGPSGWRLLHDLSFYGAEAGPSTYRKIHRFFMLLQHILPCTKCQLAYDQHLLDLPYPKNSKDLPRWVFDLHHRVNGTTRPHWETWHTSYSRVHSLRDIWPFLQSVAMSYPPGRSTECEVALYQRHAAEFFGLLWGFLAEMPEYDKDMQHIQGMIGAEDLFQNIRSRGAFQKWVTSIGRSVHALTSTVPSKCDDDCKT